MTDGKDSLAEWFSSCFVSNQDFVLDGEETLCSEGATCLTYKVRIDGRLYLTQAQYLASLGVYGIYQGLAITGGVKGKT